MSKSICLDLADTGAFPTSERLTAALEQLPPNAVVEIDARRASHLTSGMMGAIENFRPTAQARHICLTVYAGAVGSAPDSGRLPDDEAAEVADNATPAEAPAPSFERYRELFSNNREWVARKLALRPTYFEDLARGQQPQFLFIACSDSRVTIDSMTGTNPGEIFVHRNIANLVVSTDLNLLSVVQYAVSVLKVEHVIVLGHYGCGGIQAAMQRRSLGLINKWLIPIRDVMRLHHAELAEIPTEHARFRRLVELNIEEQVYNLSKTSFVQEAWGDHIAQHIHGWVYDIREGLMHDLEIDVAGMLARDEGIYRLHLGASSY